MHFSFRFSKFVIGALIFTFSVAIHAAPIYRWLDEHGTVHYGSTPPKQQQAEEMSVYKSNPSRFKEKTTEPATTTESFASTKNQGNAEQSEIDKQVRKQVAKEQEELKKQCTDMRTRLSHLRNNPRVMAEVDGKTTRLGEKERQERIKETEDKIKQYCE